MCEEQNAIIVVSKDELSEESFSSQTQSAKATSIDNVSIPGRKRKHSTDEMLMDDCYHTENEVGSSPKRSHVLASSEVGTVAHDHTYGMKSRPELKRQVDDLVTKATILKKRIDTSQKKARRLRKKVDTLASVVSELKRKSMNQ